MKKYQHVGLGGTFDHFHLGHQSLLDLAFKMGNHVSVGIARRVITKDKILPQTIEAYHIRRTAVEKYLCLQKLLARTTIVPLDDISGPASTDKTIEAIVATKETLANAKKINSLRRQKGLLPLKIIINPWVKGEDNKIIRSSRVRIGEIDRSGNVYSKIFSGKSKLTLPNYFRSSLRKPIGQVIPGSEQEIEKTAGKTLRLINRSKRTVIISVGDVITMSLIKVGFDPDIKVIDFYSRRKNINQTWREIFNRFNSNNFNAAASKLYINQPGTINVETALVLSSLVKNVIKKKEKSWLLINGEEDLLTLPAILLAPLGTIVLYGQIDLGVVLVDVTERKKKEVEEILNNFAPVYTS